MRYSTSFGAFEIDSVPGQSQLAHCHSLFVFPEFRNQGLGTHLKLYQMQLLSQLGYSYATCTVDRSNTLQQKVLEKVGWSLLKSFQNDKTGSVTQLWGWAVKDE